jgi:hypothetical protein
LEKLSSEANCYFYQPYCSNPLQPSILYTTALIRNPLLSKQLCCEGAECLGHSL